MSSRYLRGAAGAALLWLAAAAAAQEPNTTDEQLAEELGALRNRLDALETQHAREREAYERAIAELKDELERVKQRLSGPQAAPTTAPTEPAGGEDLDGVLKQLTEPATEPAAEPPAFRESVGRFFQSFNPNITAIGDFIGHYSSREGGELDDEFRFRELELAFSAVADPYTRADVFLGIHRHEGEWVLDVEEAFLTYLGMPFDLQPRVGRFRTTFGKANPLHPHALPWVEYPTVIHNYFGEEGLSGDGAGLSWLVPNPWEKYSELTYEIINNDSALFAGSESDDFVHLVHWKNFFDLSPASTFEAGATFAIAPNDVGHGGNTTMVEGLDFTYKWRPPEAGRYKSFLWQTELLAAQADLRGGQERTWGAYTAAEYQFARRWSLGTRYDYSQLPQSSSRHEQGPSAYLTFKQSEYVFWRLAYQFTDRNFPRDGNEREHEVFLQCNFGIGPHRTHKY